MEARKPHVYERFILTRPKKPIAYSCKRIMLLVICCLCLITCFGFVQKAWAIDWVQHPVDENYDDPFTVYCEDVDGDGDMDVLSGGGTNEVVWWENNDDEGTFWTKHTVDGAFDWARSVYAEDVDSDGDMDVLAAGSLSDQITWWENNDGSGTSWMEHTIDSQFVEAYDVHCEDMDGDGDMDVLGAACYGEEVAWWENNDGEGTSWTKHTVIEHTTTEEFGRPRSVYAEDVDGDGDMDVLIAVDATDKILWLENNDSSGTSWTKHFVVGKLYGAASVFCEDVDGDGDMDILGAADVANDILWWENNDASGTSWTQHIIEAEFDGARSVYCRDVDGDGDMDVIGAAYRADDITWWENDNGSGTSWTKQTIVGEFDGAWDVYSEDVDSDGAIDVLGVAHSAGEVKWWENGKGMDRSWIRHDVDEEFNGAEGVYCGDIDSDGDMDILGAADETDDIVWWENNNGSGTLWTEHTVDGEFDWANEIYCEDVNSDSNMDILGAGDDISWWKNNDGSGTSWTEYIVETEIYTFDSIYCEDVDGDGDIDIIGSRLSRIVFWENDGGSGTSWILRVIDGEFHAPESVYCEDVDGDGDIDVLGAGYDNGERYPDDITWWENDNGSGTSWTKHTVDGEFDGAWEVYCGDVDGDGDIDVLGAGYETGNEITWWENNDGLGTSWIKHIIDDEFDGAMSVYCKDIDRDGDMDVLGAGFYASNINWWENRDGLGLFWTEHPVDWEFGGAKSVCSEDIDGDGDMDILGVGGDNVTWWENQEQNGALATLPHIPLLLLD